MVEEAEGDVACSAGYVEDCLGDGGGVVRIFAGVEGADEVVFPEAVGAKGHEVVHCVVGGGDGGEYGADCGVVLADKWICLAGQLVPLDSFSASGTFSNPKCVVWPFSGLVCSCCARRWVQERHRYGSLMDRRRLERRREGWYGNRGGISTYGI